MDIKEFVSQYHNYPVLFVGTGLSLRYLENSYSWDSLLKKVAKEINPNNEYYLDLLAEHTRGSSYAYEEIAEQLEKDFEKYLKENRDGKFKFINDQFYENMERGIKVSRFKLYLAYLLKDIEIKESARDEIEEFKKVRKNVSSVITTNYDCMIERLFSFSPLIGNNILLSNPYGSVYKIHGCVTEPAEIIITKSDYDKFKDRYELIRAQLLSIFIHNPIIFIGYNIGDSNIKDILRTIFSYVDSSSEQAQKIRDNFLLIEYEEGSDNTEILEHDIDIEGMATIRINKLKTDNFTDVYKALAELDLPVSAMDIRKVQSIAREICEGGNIKVSITEDLDDLDNSDKILYLGSKQILEYVDKYIDASPSYIISRYFEIIDEQNSKLLLLLNKKKIPSTQYFPIFAFSEICPDIIRIEELKKQQKEKLRRLTSKPHFSCKGKHPSPQAVLEDVGISKTYKHEEMICSLMSGVMNLDELEVYLRSYDGERSTDYRKLLCAYDMVRYSTNAAR